MEVPVINRVGDLQLAIGRLPMLISQVPEILSFWKWGAVILAVYAIVNSVLVRFKFELIRFGNRQSDLTKALLSYSSDDDCSSDDDDYSSDVTVSSDDVDVYDEDDEEEEEEEVKEFDFRVAGTKSFEKEGDSWRRFSWSNFANGKSVVKLWDGIGLGLDISSSSGSIVAIHDLNHLQPVSQSSAPSVIVSAGKNKARNFKLSLIDTRLGRQSIIANWRSSELFSPTVDAISSGGVQRVYFGDEAGEKVRTVDLRMATEWDGDVVVGF